MALLDENFNAEEQPKKHKAIYVDAYEIYLAYIKERIEANDIKARRDQYQTRLKDLNKLQQELAFITGKYVAAEEMKNKVPTDSNLHKEFEDNENMHADMVAEKIELCHKIALLDESIQVLMIII